MTQRTIRDWQRDAYALAVAKGWYDCARCRDAPGRFDRCLCNGTGRVDTTDPIWIASRLERIHSEISEAGECVARGENFAIARDDKSEGFPIELADVFLRLVDLAEALGVELHEYEPKDDDKFDVSPMGIAAALAQLHRDVAHRYITDGGDVEGALQAFLEDLISLAHATGVDLLAMAELKHAYNQTRPYRHGEKRI